jgi:hypothetical protein
MKISHENDRTTVFVDDDGVRHSDHKRPKYLIHVQGESARHSDRMWSGRSETAVPGETIEAQAHEDLAYAETQYPGRIISLLWVEREHVGKSHQNYYPMPTPAPAGPVGRAGV